MRLGGAGVYRTGRTEQVGIGDGGRAAAFLYG
jgi:hypothetical protein